MNGVDDPSLKQQLLINDMCLKRFAPNCNCDKAAVRVLMAACQMCTRPLTAGGTPLMSSRRSQCLSNSVMCEENVAPVSQKPPWRRCDRKVLRCVRAVSCRPAASSVHRKLPQRPPDVAPLHHRPAATDKCLLWSNRGCLTNTIGRRDVSRVAIDRLWQRFPLPALLEVF